MFVAFYSFYLSKSCSQEARQNGNLAALLLVSQRVCLFVLKEFIAL